MRRVDWQAMVGQTFGQLTVLAVLPRERRHDARVRVQARCACGTEHDYLAANLRKGRVRACGCLRAGNGRKSLASHGRVRAEIVGQRYNRWTVTAIVSPRGKALRVAVRCDCGTESEVIASNLRAGLSLSCGCLARERCAEAHRTHGLSWHPLYLTWKGMIGRCSNAEDAGFANYGARGITVCARWVASFEDFLADMGEKPTPEHSIDRIDNDGGYWCGACAECVAAGRASNCRWATRAVQARNTRRNLWIEIDGTRRLLSDVCAEHGVSRQLLHVRVSSGWDLLRAATTLPKKTHGGFAAMSKKRRREVARAGHDAARGVPRLGIAAIAAGGGAPRVRRQTGRVRHIEFQGETLHLSGWAARLGISISALASRLRKLPLEQALTRPVAKRGPRRLAGKAAA